jgi:hypothetical protein
MPAGKLFQSFMVLFTKNISFICSLFTTLNFPTMSVATQVALLKQAILYRYPSRSPGVRLVQVAQTGYQSTLCQSFPDRFICRICKFSCSSLHPIWSPKIPNHIQVSVSLVTYRLDVSCYYCPVSVYALLNEEPSTLFVAPYDYS